MFIIDRIKGVLMRWFCKKDVEDATGIKTALSQAMADRLLLWRQMAAGCAPWNDGAPPSGVIQTITGELARPVAQEIEIKSRNKELETVMHRMDKSIEELVQHMATVGACVVRPIFANDKVQWEIIPMGGYLPIVYDFDGSLLEALIVSRREDGEKVFLIIEHHTYRDKSHAVENKLYRVYASGVIKEVPLTDFDQTAGITPYYEWADVEYPFIVEFRSRKVNNIDRSAVPVPIIAGAENLVEDVDRQYERICWEVESARRRTFIDEDLIRPVQGAPKKLDAALARLFVKLSGDGMDAGKIVDYSPAIRVAELNDALQQMLRRLELACEIGKGTLSDMEAVQQTATQYEGGRKAFFSAVDAIEDEIELKYRQLAYVFAYMLSAYKGVTFDPEIEIAYNDATRKDPLKAKQIAMQELAAGVLNEWEYRKVFYGEDDETARANVPEREAGGFVL